MNKVPNNTKYFESSDFVHHRYHDTALLIFHQQQKKRHDDEVFSHATRRPRSDENVDFGHYGNTGVVAKQKPPVMKNFKSDPQPVQSVVCSVM